MESATDTATTPGHTRLIQALSARIEERVATERLGPVLEFARAYARRIPADVAGQLDPEELFGQVMGAFELADRRGFEPFAVRAFNPSLASDGYSTIGSVVETNTDDSPFLVDSVSEELNARGLEIRLVVHPVIGTERDAEGRIQRVLHARGASRRESVMHFETARHASPKQLADLEAAIRAILVEVQATVRDFKSMTDRVPEMVESARGSGKRFAPDEIEETELFLWWLLDGNYVFLGYREYSLENDMLSVVPGRGLGILASDEGSAYAQPVPLAEIDPGLRERLTAGNLLVVSKTNRFASVHRRVKMDDITVKRIGPDGVTVGALRLVGLFTRKAYMAPAGRIPILSRKLRQIAVAEDFLEDSHDYKTLVALFESFPKDELFVAGVDELRDQLVALLDLQERQQTQLFIRPDIEERRVAVLVALPRDRFNAQLRHRLQDLFLERFHGSSIDYHLSLSEEEQARIHFTVHVDGEIPEVSLTELEQEVTSLARTWDDRLRERLVALHGEERGSALAERYAKRLPDYYKSSTDVYLAVLDVEQFERLERDGEPFAVALQNERGKDQNLTRVGLYKTGGKVVLSDVVPILEDLGLTVVEEVPTRLRLDEGEAFLHDFGVLDAGGSTLDLNECGERIAETISAVWRDETESDSLNRLVVVAGLTWRQVEILRALRTYRLRVGSALGLEYRNEAYARNPEISRKLLRLLELRFGPGASDPPAEEGLRAEIRDDLDRVESLDEDRILRAALGLIEAMVRTNAYVPGRRHLAFKFDSALVPGIPKPAPLCEIFVYSTHMEGIHLRGGRVARGGIRWSDRREDYRTEILGLMKAQMVKNAVIVPVGSKGGFVLKRPPSDPGELKAAVAEQYSTLMRGLLDLTDNLVGGEVVHPAGVRVLDGDDPYLVVAADKGTASFSDLANEIAAEYGFWLGDAFASGGSEGYDHKELGITARGAWESVKRHFRELGHDVMASPFTVIGIGDMSGDVFGNGMLYTDRIRLVAAFDHRHLFVDPDPDPAVSFAERKRLFELPGSSWNDYDRSLLSAGGGIYARTEKHIDLSPEARAALAIETAGPMPPSDVLAAVLRAPVDLFWNGGIGTFVKASYEANADVGDRTNDAIRVSGSDLRVRVVGEGGNLGFTQKARIEYAESGGRINTDAIDNSAGVDCSDHEVNLKILLGIAVASGDLTVKQRNDLLRKAEQDVAAHVLYDNYLQAQILSQEEAVSVERLESYEDLMVSLEAHGMLDRDIESLPWTEQMSERRRAGRGMARPELCILLAYAKRSLEEAIRQSPLPDDPYLERDLRRYFPPRIVERFGDRIWQHPLRRELASTIIANEVVNAQGITFVTRLCAETGAEPAEVARAYYIARDVTGGVERWDDVEALDGKIDPVLQNVLMVGVDTLVADLSRWYLLHGTASTLGQTIDEAKPAFQALAGAIEDVGSPAWRLARESIAQALEVDGVPADLARRHAFQPELAHSADIVLVSRQVNRPLEEVANAFFLTGERFHLDWLEAQLKTLPETSNWERWAAQAMEDDLMALRRDIALGALQEADAGPVEAALEAYVARRSEPVDRLARLLQSLEAQGQTSLPALTVALRQLRSLVG